jgi:hypothetical protein
VTSTGPTNCCRRRAKTHAAEQWRCALKIWALVTTLRPQTESELAIALAILKAREIESFVHGIVLEAVLFGWFVLGDRRSR